MTATAATFLTGLTAALPPSSRVSSTTVSIFLMRMSSSPSLVCAGRGAVTRQDLGGPGRGRRVAAPADPDLPVDEDHGDPAEVAGAERLERGLAHRADRRVHDSEIGLAPHGDHAHRQAVYPCGVPGGHGDGRLRPHP